MRFLIQHTEQSASITIDGDIQSISHGCIIYVGFHRDDFDHYQTKIDTFIQKIQTTKLFRLPNGDKIDASLTDTGGSVLLVPNFTLHSRNKKGNSIDYTHSAPFAQGQTMRDYLRQALLEKKIPHITGKFGAEMHITSTINGPINHIRDY